MQDKLFEIIENEDINDVVDLNEKFLAAQLGIEASQLSMLPKIELRVDTNFHNLQVTGEILTSLECLKMNDSIVDSFRDLGTSFRNLRILYLARCGLKEVQGIQAFEQLEELYMGFNYVNELFDIGFIEHLTVLDFENNAISDLDQLRYLERCKKLTDLTLKDNPVCKKNGYYKAIKDGCPQLEELDEQNVESYVQQSYIESSSEVHLPIINKLLDFGVPATDIEEITSSEPFQRLENEKNDFLMFSDRMHEPKEVQQVQQEPQMGNTFTSGFGLTRGESFSSFNRGESPDSKMRQSTRAFFKDALGKSGSKFFDSTKQDDNEPNDELADPIDILKRGKKRKEQK